MSVPDDPDQNPQPDVDLTVGTTPIVGDAPPADGTGVDVTVNPTTAAAALRQGAAVLPHFHTAAARAAAFPGLQSEVETFGSAFGALAHGGSDFGPPGGD
jgi:hypothetical protein